MDVGPRHLERMTSIYLPFLHARRLACYCSVYTQAGSLPPRACPPAEGSAQCDHCLQARGGGRLAHPFPSTFTSPGASRDKGSVLVMGGTFIATAHCWKGRGGPLTLPSMCMARACAGSELCLGPAPTYSCLQGAPIVMCKSLELGSSGFFILKPMTFQRQVASKAKH